MSYKRVLPRDLFNESVLLKCLGKITLLIHDEMIKGLSCNHEDSSKGFNVVQDPNTGFISVENLHFFDDKGTPVYFYTSLNARDPWPLWMEYRDSEYVPINDNGKYQLWSELFVTASVEEISLEGEVAEFSEDEIKEIRKRFNQIKKEQNNGKEKN